MVEASTGKRVAYVVRYRVEDGAMPEVLAALTAMAELVREGEPGCLVYHVNRDPDDRDVLVLYEAYADDEAYQRHCATPYFQRHVVGTVRPRLAERAASRYEQVLW